MTISRRQASARRADEHAAVRRVLHRVAQRRAQHRRQHARLARQDHPRRDGQLQLHVEPVGIVLNIGQHRPQLRLRRRRHHLHQRRSRRRRGRRIARQARALLNANRDRHGYADEHQGLHPGRRERRQRSEQVVERDQQRGYAIRPEVISDPHALRHAQPWRCHLGIGGPRRRMQPALDREPVGHQHVVALQLHRPHRLADVHQVPEQRGTIDQPACGIQRASRYNA